MKTQYNLSLLTMSLMLHCQISHAADVQAWLFNGEPGCNAAAEYSDGRTISVLKPQYYYLGADGSLIKLVAPSAGCNSYSAANIASIKKYSQQQFTTVGAHLAEMRALFKSSTKRKKALTEFVSFVTTNKFTGIEIDFEDYWLWTSTDYKNYKLFLTDLGNQLHLAGAKLMVDGPGFSSNDSGLKWTYSDFNTLPIDYLVVMVYDYDWDVGGGAPISPNAWATNVINYVKSKITDINKLVIGMPSYGYHATIGQYNIVNDTYAQTSTYAGFNNAVMDPNSFEYHWTIGDTAYYFQRSDSMDAKRKLIEDLGIQHISLWHLGGNQWFSRR